jgi:hypothetical protein
MEDTREATLTAGETIISAIAAEIRGGKSCNDVNCVIPHIYDDLTDAALDGAITALGRMTAVNHICWVNGCLYHMVQERERRKLEFFQEAFE